MFFFPKTFLSTLPALPRHRGGTGRAGFAPTAALGAFLLAIPASGAAVRPDPDEGLERRRATVEIVKRKERQARNERFNEKLRDRNHQAQSLRAVEILRENLAPAWAEADARLEQERRDLHQRERAEAARDPEGHREARIRRHMALIDSQAGVQRSAKAFQAEVQRRVQEERAAEEAMPPEARAPFRERAMAETQEEEDRQMRLAIRNERRMHLAHLLAQEDRNRGIHLRNPQDFTFQVENMLGPRESSGIPARIPAPKPSAAVPMKDDLGRPILGASGEKAWMPEGWTIQGFARAVIPASIQDLQERASRGGPWDLQRVDRGREAMADKRFRDASAIALGVQAAVQGIPFPELAEAQERLAAGASTGDGEKHGTYAHVDRRTIRNLEIGYELVNSGRLKIQNEMN